MHDAVVHPKRRPGELPAVVVVAAALLLELVLLAGVAKWVQPAKSRLAEPAYKLTLTLLDSIASPEPSTPEPAAPAPQQIPRQHAFTRPPVRSMPRATTSQPAAKLPQPVAPLTSAETVVTAQPAGLPAPPAGVASSAADEPQVRAKFTARLRPAIQAALIYPPAARDAGFHGKARVEFVLRDGTARNPLIVESSGMGLIDRAALNAVENARYPPVPPSLVGKDGPYRVTVRFDLSDQG
jgi:protein TonB